MLAHVVDEGARVLRRRWRAGWAPEARVNKLRRSEADGDGGEQELEHCCGVVGCRKSDQPVVLAGAPVP